MPTRFTSVRTPYPTLEQERDRPCGWLRFRDALGAWGGHAVLWLVQSGAGVFGSGQQHNLILSPWLCRLQGSIVACTYLSPRLHPPPAHSAALPELPSRRGHDA